MKNHNLYIAILFISLVTWSCKDEGLDIRGDFPYTVTVDSLPRSILVDSQLPLRLKINVEGNYTEAKFSLNYVLREGKGGLKTDKGIIINSGGSFNVVPGDINIVYTPSSTEKTDMFFSIRDNFGQEKTQEVTFVPVANAPTFNFVIQTLSGRESISNLETQKYSFYLRQQSFYLANQVYQLSFACSNNFDGSLLVNGKTWRQGDLIPIEYDQIKDSGFLFEADYKPIAPAVGSYSVSFTITDKFGISKSQSKPITVN